MAQELRMHLSSAWGYGTELHWWYDRGQDGGHGSGLWMKLTVLGQHGPLRPLIQQAAVHVHVLVP